MIINAVNGRPSRDPVCNRLHKPALAKFNDRKIGMIDWFAITLTALYDACAPVQARDAQILPQPPKFLVIQHDVMRFYPNCGVLWSVPVEVRDRIKISFR